MILEATPGVLAKVPAWSSRALWLDELDDELRTEAAGVILREIHVSADAVVDVARADAASADSRSGRNVATSHATVASRVGRSKRVVQRARSVLELLGFARTVVAGRYLFANERKGDQIRAASNRALTNPPGRQRRRRPRPPGRRRLHRGYLPRRGRDTPATYVPEMVNQRSRAASNRTPRPVWAQKLAAAIALRQPWLLRYRKIHIGALVTVLVGRVSPDATSERIHVALERANRLAGRDSTPADLQRDPLALFSWQLARLDPADLVAPEDAATRRRRANLPAALGDCAHWDRFEHGFCVHCGEPTGSRG